MEKHGLIHKLSLTCEDNVNYYKSAHHPIPAGENKERPGNFKTNQ